MIKTIVHNLKSLHTGLKVGCPEAPILSDYIWPKSLPSCSKSGQPFQKNDQFNLAQLSEFIQKSERCFQTSVKSKAEALCQKE